MRNKLLALAFALSPSLAAGQARPRQADYVESEMAVVAHVIGIEENNPFGIFNNIKPVYYIEERRNITIYHCIDL